MRTIPDLEISLHKRNHAYCVEAHFRYPSSDVDVRSKFLHETSIDFVQLDALVRCGELDAYGQVLSEAIFSHQEILEIFSRALNTAGTDELRLRLVLGPTVPELQALHWETLKNPLDKTSLAANENILFSRYLSGPIWSTVRVRPRTEVKALIAISNPNDLEKYNLPAVDVSGEFNRAATSLKAIQTRTLLSGQEKCTLKNLIQKLSSGVDVLYLVAHGTLAGDQPWVWLEKEDGTSERVSGVELAKNIRALRLPPLLIVLASCESAGKATAATEGPTALQALGPLLAEAGVPAVLAMQGKILMSSVASMMPVFFAELLKDGQVDRALALARMHLMAEKAPDAWMPALFMRLPSGEIWRDDPVKTQFETISKRLSSLGSQERIWFVVVLLAILGMGVGVVWALKPRQPVLMTGDFRIAVASFYENGRSGQENLGYDLAESVRLRLEQDLKELSPELVITIWGPDKIGAISGSTPDDRVRAAEKIVNDVHADLVIYGVVDVTGDSWQVLPEFYISAQNFYEAREIVGQHDLGMPINLPGSAANTAWRFEFGKQMFTRGKVLAVMSEGLGYLALHQYDQALIAFQNGLNISGWDDEQGKKVLYIMTGFAAGKGGDAWLDQGQIEKAQVDFGLAQELFQKALAIDPEYARPYIGIANLNYMRSLMPYKQSKDYRDVDNGLLDQCLEYLDRAEAAQNKPVLAEVETKIHFARGQCLMIKAFSGAITAQPAYDEFQLVLQAYGDGKNPRVRDMAAEAHARLGLIYRLLKKSDLALIEYKAAVDLLYDYPERQAVYKDRVMDLSSQLTPAP